jgi:hypothetical protein
MTAIHMRPTESARGERGKPAARWVPRDGVPADAFGLVAGSVLGHDDIVAPDLDAWGKGGGAPRVGSEPRRR